MNIKSLYPHGVAIFLFVCVSVIYFLPQFQGKVLVQGDIVSYKGMAKEIIDYNTSSEDTALWTNSMFGGMPAYQINVPQKSNISKYFQQLLSFGLPRPAGLFLFGCICGYLLFLLLGISPWIAIFLAIGTAFTTNNLILLEAGHMTKVTSLMSVPLIIGGTILSYRKKTLLGVAVFTLGMMLNLKANHYQMTFYLALCLLIYVIIELVQHVKTQTVPSFFKSSLMLLLGLSLAFGTGASKLITTYEYSKDTMRGDPILVNNVDPSSSSSVDGLAWDYAMQWSNGGLDLIASFIPKIVGGGSGEKISPRSTLGKKLRLKKAEPFNVYWGSLPFTSGPIYFGSIFIFLFVLGSIIVKGSVKWWAVSAVILTMVLSLGKNFELINRLFFEYFPFYNKFRTPNSVLSVTAFIIPVLSALGLNQVLKAENKVGLIKPVLIVSGSLIGMTLFLAFLGPSLFSFSSPGDVRYEQAGFPVDLLEDHRVEVLRKSCMKTILLILLTAASIFFYLKGKLHQYFMIAILGTLSIADLMSVNLDYVSSEDFVSERMLNRDYFTPRAVDEQIMSDSDPHYRVLDLSINTFNSSRSSYFHKTIGGYHAAKLQRYQDIIVNQISNNNQNVLNMLNAKYIISNNNGNQPVARINPSHLGNAWFVNEVIFVETADDEMAQLNNFDPLGQAIIHDEYRELVATNTLNKSGSIDLTSYSPNELRYRASSESDQLAVFSEVWYGEDKGWKIYIDDQEVPLIRANYVLRAAMIPSGNHEVIMKFAPETYAKGETMSLIASILSILFIGLCVFFHFKTQSSDTTSN